MDQENTQQNQKELTSGSVLLNTMQLDYQTEISRITTLDTKISIAMAVVTGALFFILQSWDRMVDGFKAIPDMSSVGGFWLSVSNPLFQAVSIGLLIMDLIILVSLIRTTEYKTVNPADYCDVDFLSMKPDDASVGLLEAYDAATKINRKISDKRAKRHNISLVIMVVAIGLYIFTLIF